MNESLVKLSINGALCVAFVLVSGALFATDHAACGWMFLTVAVGMWTKLIHPWPGTKDAPRGGSPQTDDIESIMKG